MLFHLPDATGTLLGKVSQDLDSGWSTRIQTIVSGNLGLQPLHEHFLPGAGSACVLSLPTVTCRPEHLLCSMEQLLM